ncbi:MAG: thioredoxin [Verrucomicrobiota bacterium]
MKTGNIGLWAVVAFLAWAGWIVLDMSLPASSPKKATETGSSLLVTLKTSRVPVLVEFYADWCDPCKNVGPVVEELSREVGAKARVIRINVDDQPAASNEHGVRSIPTFIAFENGKETQRQVGAIPKRVMQDMLGL